MPNYFHYTSIESFFEIVKSGKLRATSLEFLNDPRELTLGYEITKEFLNNLGFTPNSLEQKHLRVFKEEFFKVAPTLHPLSISFSALEDALPQWLAYGDNGRGVCFEFARFPFGEGDGDPVFEASVAYSEQEFRNRIEEIYLDSQKTFIDAYEGGHEEALQIEARDEMDQVFFGDIMSLRLQCAAYKHESWQHENEIRAATFAWMFGGGDNPVRCALRLPEIVRSGAADGIQYSLRNLQLVPHTDLVLPKTDWDIDDLGPKIVLQRLWLGPNCSLEHEILGCFLENYDWMVSEIKSSNCSFR